MAVKRKRAQGRISEPQIGAKEKIEEASYFLRRLNRVRPGVIGYYLSAFLSAWRSVLDVLLFDFAQMYSLGFDSKDRVDDEGFEIAARAMKQKEALRFLAWWRRQLEHVSNSPLYRARNMIIHRGRSPLHLSFPLTPPASLPPSNRLVIEKIPVRVRFLKGKRKGMILTGKGIRSIKLPPQPKWVKIELVFEDFPTRKVTDVCEEAFKKMKSIVEIAERDFWRPKEKKESAEVRTTIQVVRDK
ncbi:MAG: hypothetical protein ABSD99_10795 [Candidatus Bathyarchaeia archaeon]